jgi:hypothetical protein
MAYFDMPKARRKVGEVLNIGAPDMYSIGSPIMASTTTLKEISVFPLRRESIGNGDTPRLGACHRRIPQAEPAKRVTGAM